MAFFNSYPYTDFHELNLDWFLSQFKTLTDDYENFHKTISEEWDKTKDNWTELYTYVHDYFDNLDVQEEVDKKLDGLVADGTFSRLISAIIGNDNIPTFVNSVSQMTDRKRVYVLTSDKHLYTYTGAMFTDTGVEYGVSNDALIADVRITPENYESLGIRTVTDLKPNRVYGITSGITAEMVSNLATYGTAYTIITSKPLSEEASTGYTTYIAVVGTSRTATRLYAAFSYANGSVSNWLLSENLENVFRGFTTLLNRANHAGITTLRDFAPNTVYAISRDITESDIAGLPVYNQYGNMRVFKAFINPTSTGYTVYEYSCGTSAGTQLHYIAFNSSNSGEIRWHRLSGDANTLTVGENKEFPTISSAVAAASEGDTILIYPGIYRENVDSKTKTLHYKGIDKNSCIVIDSSGLYATPPFEVKGGSISNLTIIEDGHNPSGDYGPYCIHIDFADTTALTVDNCILKNSTHACIGIGVRPGTDITVRNTEMYTDGPDLGLRKRGVFYIHTRNDTLASRVKCSMKDCLIDSSFDYAMSLQELSNTTCAIDFEFINNTAIASGSVAPSIIDDGSQTGTPQEFTSANMRLLATSHGNNIGNLNS